MEPILLGGFSINVGSPCLLIAEIGTSHNGDIDRARMLVDQAKGAGADCVKSQLVFADEIVHPLTGRVSLPGGHIPLYERFKELERDIGFYSKMKSYTEERGMLFLCSVFGTRSARLLKSLDAAAVKIASPELNYCQLLEEVRSYNMPIILSSGVSTLGDIESALSIVGKQTVLLHCVTAYPAPEREYNLRLIHTLSSIFGIHAGISDHSMNPILIPTLAATLGARIIEKHFTLSKSGEGLDDPIALDPDQFADMVKSVREAEQMGAKDAIQSLNHQFGCEEISQVLGSGVKQLAPSERRIYRTTNRSIIAVCDISQGEAVRSEAAAVLRSEKNIAPGIHPRYLPLILGKKAKRRILSGCGIGWEDLL